MKKTMRNQRSLFVGLGMFSALAVSLLFVGCETVPKSVPKGFTQPEFFQKAQEAADQDNWQASLFYYRTFEKRFPNDTPNMAAADYEIAFIYYKQHKYKEAKAGFEALLEKYKQKDATELPQWPGVLAKEILAEVDQHLRMDAKTDPGLKITIPTPSNQNSSLGSSNGQ